MILRFIIIIFIHIVLLNFQIKTVFAELTEKEALEILYQKAGLDRGQSVSVWKDLTVTDGDEGQITVIQKDGRKSTLDFLPGIGMDSKGNIISLRFKHLKIIDLSVFNSFKNIKLLRLYKSEIKSLAGIKNLGVFANS